jgi:HK97 family phage portal protein
LYDYFVNQYSWVQNTNQNKQLGNYQVYYQAGKNTYVNDAINAYFTQLLTNGFTIKNPNLESIDLYKTKYLEGLFNAPEGLQSNIRYSQFLRQIVNSYLLVGDAFIEISYDNVLDNEIINGFKFIPPELIRWYDDTSQYGFVNNENLRFEPGDLVHIYDPPIRIDNKFGDSRIDTIGLALSLLFESLKYNKDFFKSGGIDPNAIVSFDKEMTNTDFMNEVSRLSAQAKQNRRGTLALKGGTIQTISNLKDADFSNLIVLSRNIILNGYNVPPSLAGIVETANLSANTIDSEMRVFKPFVGALAETVEGAFNQVLGRNGFSEVFEFNPIDLTDKLEEMNIRKMELETGLKSINEIRQEIGLEPVYWGDKPLGLMDNSEPAPEIDTGDKTLDEAFNLIRQAETDVYRTYDYLNGGLYG